MIGSLVITIGSAGSGERRGLCAARPSGRGRLGPEDRPAPRDRAASRGPPDFALLTESGQSPSVELRLDTCRVAETFARRGGDEAAPGRGWARRRCGPADAPLHAALSRAGAMADCAGAMAELSGGGRVTNTGGAGRGAGRGRAGGRGSAWIAVDRRGSTGRGPWIGVDRRGSVP